MAMPTWLSTIVNVILILNSLVLIVSVLMQDGARSGLGTIGGGAETFFGKTKAKSYEGKLEMITKISAGTFILLAIVMTASNARQGLSNVTPVDTSNLPSASDILDQKKKGAGDGQELPTLPEATPAPEAADDAVAPEVTAEPAVEATEPAVEATEPAVEVAPEATPAA